MTSPGQGEVPDPQNQPIAAAGPKTMTDLLGLAAPERSLINWLLRQRGASLADIVAHTQAAPATIQTMLGDLTAAGFLTLHNDVDPAVYKPNLVSRKPRILPEKLWKAVE
ncbi:MAG: hypothetical protein DCF32_02880 [Leptolyngbya sp.]|nr:MAG: hypothetical protein DCF32_02880 [Leptolyngbya sp.]